MAPPAARKPTVTVVSRDVAVKADTYSNPKFAEKS
jgi:hypothetical protein